MKKILLLICFFFFVPIIKAETVSKVDNIKNLQLDIPVIRTANEEETADEETPNEVTDWGEIEDTSLESICASPNLRKPLKFIGTIVSVIKIAIPILIIVFGIIDLFKAIPSSKDDRIMVAAKSIGVRFIAGVFIFFIPGIIQFVLDWVNEWSKYSNSWCCCTQCLLDSGNCDVNSCSSESCKIGGMN